MIKKKLTSFHATIGFYSFLMTLGLMALPAHLLAAPIYTLTHNADGFGHTGPSEFVGPQNAPIQYDFDGITYFTGANSGKVHATVNPSSIGIHTQAIHNFGYALQRQEVTAEFAFDVYFGSSGTSPIDVVMNLDLAGYILKPNPSNIYSGVEVRDGSSYGQSSGSHMEVNDGVSPAVLTSGMLAGFVDDGTKQIISTSVMTVPVNSFVQMYFQLKTLTNYDGTAIAFGDTLNLTTSGDVFSILSGSDITVNSVDAGIVNNQY
ncbi:hypothetical protein SAMN05216302_1004152 [Nitrosomonas aestuarii]|uniref:Uncharacterized protein n=1 Tax=Nitrosomonas aestuarii TaxID=52441 RepID=A0A1I3YVP4_9PROT|nr:hypothetical protein [Nitrosomonas aestuarii]SFK35281.1 hypothetical protein SAMN05216302_1004152 [Nitrosomonas aestuarii]